MTAQQDKATYQALAYYLTNTAKVTVVKLGNGHINQTFLVSHAQGDFVLQRINDSVFPQPQVLVNNALAIDKYLVEQGTLYPFVSIAPLPSLAGNYLENIDGQYWRAFSYIRGCSSVETMDSCEQAQQAAYAFATFSATLAGIDDDALTPVIEHFHDLEFRLEQLSQAISDDKEGRLSSAKPLVDLFLSQGELVTKVNQLVKNLPVRIVHNDTKINNLLFNQSTGKPYAVIDLDTCMPGYLMHDFGDMVRTCCSNLAEDAVNVKEMQFKRDIYDALHQGYVAGAKSTITPLEVESLSLGAVLMPFIIGSRFLTDYLNGDAYFGIAYPQHNFDRAANQFAFYQLLEKQITS